MANPTPALETQLGLYDWWRSPQAGHDLAGILDDEKVALSIATMYSDNLLQGQPYYVDPTICHLLVGSAEDFPLMPVRELSIPAVAGWVHFAVPLLLTGETMEPSTGIKGFAWTLWDPDDDPPNSLNGQYRSSYYRSEDETKFAQAVDPSRAVHVTVDVYLDDTARALPRFGWMMRMEMGDSWNALPDTEVMPWLEGVNPWHQIDVYRVWRESETIPEAADDVARAARRYFMTFMAFIQQTLISVTDGRPDRATRRRLPKWFHEDPIIKVVKLRRSESARSPDPSNAGEWAFQWLVSGHWRRQWYPASNRHKPIWISPHVKGPENKPLKRASIQLYSVER